MPVADASGFDGISLFNNDKACERRAEEGNAEAAEERKEDKQLCKAVDEPVGHAPYDGLCAAGRLFPSRECVMPLADASGFDGIPLLNNDKACEGRAEEGNAEALARPQAATKQMSRPPRRSPPSGIEDEDDDEDEHGNQRGLTKT